jgi:hypothetical protein
MMTCQSLIGGQKLTGFCHFLIKVIHNLKYILLLLTTFRQALLLMYSFLNHLSLIFLSLLSRGGLRKQ